MLGSEIDQSKMGKNPMTTCELMINVNSETMSVRNKMRQTVVRSNDSNKKKKKYFKVDNWKTSTSARTT